MSDKTQLQGMLDNLINDKAEEAQINFHQYLQDKMKDVLSDNTVDKISSENNKNSDKE
jgi:hypothetical protein